MNLELEIKPIEKIANKQILNFKHMFCILN